MAKKHFTVPEVPGSGRSSERPYSHAIVGRYNPHLVAAKARATHAKNAAQSRRWDAKNWNDWKRSSEATVGQLYRNHNGFMVEAKDYEVRIGKEFMAKYPTLESYLAHLESEHQGRLAALDAGQIGELQVLQWSMSHKNAVKAAGSFADTYSDLRVVEVVEATKPAHKAKAA
jgi:hypothetical protein